MNNKQAFYEAEKAQMNKGKMLKFSDLNLSANLIDLLAYERPVDRARDRVGREILYCERE